MSICNSCRSNPCRCSLLCIQGDTGATGTIVGSYSTAADLQRAQPPGKPGEHYLVGRDVYGYDPNINGWRNIGPLGGPSGPAGAAGTSTKLTIGSNGNWFTNGVDTGKPARGSGSGAQTPISVGSNGNWYILTARIPVYLHGGPEALMDQTQS